MMVRVIRLFLVTAGLLLLITAEAKLVTAVGPARVLDTPDPIIGLPFRYFFLVAGQMELGVAMVCLFAKGTRLPAAVLAWFATALLIYRVGLLVVSYKKPCPCLGSLTDALHISPGLADSALKVVLAYLLVGSYTALAWRQKRDCVSINAK